MGKLLSFARRAFAIFYMVLPFLVFFLFVFFYWRTPDPTLTNPASSNFNEFEGPVDWTLTYSFWEMLPALPLLIWPVPIALWLYRNPPTLCKGICVALSFFAFICITLIGYMGFVFNSMAR